MTDPVIKAVIDGILKTGTRAAFDETLRERGFKVVPIEGKETEEPVSNTWEDWSRLHDTIGIRGWAVSNFPIQIANGLCEFVVGITRDMFGIYRVRGTYRSVDHTTGALSLEEGAEACWLVHLRSGILMGIFRNPEHAALAGEIANRQKAWRSLRVMTDEEWPSASNQLMERLHLAGIVQDPSYTIQTSPSHIHPVFHQIPEILEYGRPERLS